MNMHKDWFEESTDKPPALKTLPVAFKIFGALCFLMGLLALAMIGIVILSTIGSLQDGSLGRKSTSATSTIIAFILVALLAALSMGGIALGVQLLRNRRRSAAVTIDLMIVAVIAISLCSLMLYGLNSDQIVYGIMLGILIALSSYIDPSLFEERELQRKLRKMEERSAAESGELTGLDPSGKGYISLNFFNLFWIFTICCVIGLILETIYHAVVFGGYEDRSGMLFGPFSPIYGFGAVLMTLVLNRFHHKSWIMIFLVSAVIGGAFEYLVSWFMQFAFGVIAWDYSGTWLSIDGRTNGQFMIFWGILGLAWIKFLLPQVLRMVKLIPWNWRYTLTVVCASLLILDGTMTLMSLDFWYERSSGSVPEKPVELFFADHFDDDFMQNRFQSMSIDPENSTRT